MAYYIKKILKFENIIFLFSSAILIFLKITVGDFSFFEKYIDLKNHSIELIKWYSWLYHFILTFSLFFCVPLILNKLIFKRELKNIGLGIGDWQTSLKATIVLVIISTPLLYFSSKNKNVLIFYPQTTLAVESISYFIIWCIGYLLHYIGWEFFFRGYMTFFLKRYYGVFFAIFIPTILTTLLHINRPIMEVFGALLIGIIFGTLVIKTNNIYTPVITHWYIGIMNTYFTSIMRYQGI